MAYFPDLTFYGYSSDGPPETLNIGWLARGQEFDRMTPTEEILDLLWSYCSISVMQSRGIHECDLCAVPQTVHGMRNGARLLLGSSEIRVFSRRVTVPLCGSAFAKRSPVACFFSAVPQFLLVFMRPPL